MCLKEEAGQPQRLPPPLLLKTPAAVGWCGVSFHRWGSASWRGDRGPSSSRTAGLVACPGPGCPSPAAPSGLARGSPLQRLPCAPAWKPTAPSSPSSSTSGCFPARHRSPPDRVHGTALMWVILSPAGRRPCLELPHLQAPAACGGHPLREGAGRAWPPRVFALLLWVPAVPAPRGSAACVLALAAQSFGMAVSLAKHPLRSSRRCHARLPRSVRPHVVPGAAATLGLSSLWLLHARPPGLPRDVVTALGSEPSRSPPRRALGRGRWACGACVAGAVESPRSGPASWRGS